MVKDTELLEDKGVPTCSQKEEVMSLGGTQEVWSVVRNSGNNAWYVNTNGNANNNNTYNRYVGAALSELSDNIDEFLAAEKACYENKHDSVDATRTHYHLSKVNELAKQVLNGTWEQGKAYVFACSYPTTREIWAAFYPDRIVHHLIAPALVAACEKVHNANGDVSHGNRLKHSAETACIQIWENMQKFPNGYVGTRDLSGFFMSIPRGKSCEMTEEQMQGYEHLPIVRKLILHDPTTNCEIRASQEEMDSIPQNKSLFHAKEGCGLPIGNFYSQLDANLYLWPVDALHLTPKWKGKVGYTRFVDDMAVTAKDGRTVNEFFADVERVVNSLGCRMHPKKKYLQPISHGVAFCGRVIKPHGIYISNRTLNAIRKAIEQTERGLEGARKIVKSLNSYYGFLSHCKAYKFQLKFAEMATEKWGEYICYIKSGSQIVFKMKEAYTNKAESIRCIEQLKNNSYLWN